MTRQGSFHPFVLAALLAGGFGVVWGIVGVWAVEVGEYAATKDRHVETLRFLADGTPLVERRTLKTSARSHHDLDGNPVPWPKGESPWLGECLLPARRRSPAEDGSSWGDRLASFGDGHTRPVFWYFVRDAAGGAGYFVGYDSGTKARVGYLGTAGFRESPVAAGERIPVAGGFTDGGPPLVATQPTHRGGNHPSRTPLTQGPPGTLSGWDVYALGPDGQVHHVDLQHRRVRRFLEGVAVRSLGVTATAAERGQATPYHLAARTADAVLVLDDRGMTRESYPIPEALRERAFLFGRATTGEAVMYRTQPREEGQASIAYHVCWVRPDGRHREAAPQVEYHAGMQSMRLLSGIVLPAPLPVAAIVATVPPAALLREGLAANYPEALARSLRQYGVGVVVAQLIAIALAVLCYRRQVRYGAMRRERLLWPLFVLMLGLPGWVSYRFGRSWPALESCPGCGAVVPCDRDGCADCAAAFPAPAPRGIEVFA